MILYYDGIPDSDLQALADNEISSVERTVLMALIYERPQAMRRLEQLLYQKMILKEFWKKNLVEEKKPPL